MTKVELLQIAEKNQIKAQKTYDNNINRKGISAEEAENLKKNVEYTTIVYQLIKEMRGNTL